MFPVYVQWAGDFEGGDYITEGSEGQTTGSYQRPGGGTEENQRRSREEVQTSPGGRKWGTFTVALSEILSDSKTFEHNQVKCKIDFTAFSYLVCR